MAAIFGEGKIFLKIEKNTFLRYPVGQKFRRNCSIFQRVPSLHTLWVENFDEITLSRMVKEIEAILCFAIFGKNPKIQNGPHFWEGEIFLKIPKITFLRYPVGRKLRQNRSISHG